MLFNIYDNTHVYALIYVMRANVCTLVEMLSFTKQSVRILISKSVSASNVRMMCASLIMRTSESITFQFVFLNSTHK